MQVVATGKTNGHDPKLAGWFLPEPVDGARLERLVRLQEFRRWVLGLVAFVQPGPPSSLR